MIKDNLLKKGQSQRPNGTYSYRWTDKFGKRHSIYAKTLKELRAQETTVIQALENNSNIEIKNITVNDIFDLWKQLKRGLKDNTFQNYQYMYETFVKPEFGRIKIVKLKKSDVKRFYNTLSDERCLKPSTVESVHTVLHQVLDTAVDDNYLPSNPSDNVLKELKQSHVFKIEKRRALTLQEQNLFLSYIKNNETYNHWYPIFAVMIGTGLRAGEVTGLRWCDIDLDNNIIDVNHTLVYYSHGSNKCYYNVHTPKTINSNRTIPMLSFVKEAFLIEQQSIGRLKAPCSVVIDGYTDFIFVNRFGATQYQGTLNKAIRRIIRDCNDEILTKDPNAKLLLPNFSCHSLRHTFATRMCEAGINIKVIQDILGHADVSTTLNIYTDATKDLKNKEFEEFESVFKLDNLHQLTPNLHQKGL